MCPVCSPWCTHTVNIQMDLSSIGRTRRFQGWQQKPGAEEKLEKRAVCPALDCLSKQAMELGNGADLID